MRIKVQWDFEGTDLEGVPYYEALATSGLPETTLVPIDITYGDDDDITDWISDEYGFTVTDWTELEEG